MLQTKSEKSSFECKFHCKFNLFFAYIKKSLMDLGTSHVHDLLSFVIHLCKKTPNLKCMSIKYWRFFVWTCQRKCFTLDLFYTWRKFLLISRWCWKMQKNSHIQKALCTFEFGNFNFLIFLNEMQSFHSNLETQLEKQFQSLSHDHHYMFVSLSLNFMEPFPRGSNHQTIF